MRSDARKRMAVKRPAPIGVARDDMGDWGAACDGTCGSPLDLWAALWVDAYEAALGHACLHHRSAS